MNLDILNLDILRKVYEVGLGARCSIRIRYPVGNHEDHNSQCEGLLTVPECDFTYKLSKPLSPDQDQTIWEQKCNFQLEGMLPNDRTCYSHLDHHVDCIPC